LIITCMHLILPPLLTLPKLVLLERRLTGSPALDLRPRNGATDVADDAITEGAIVSLTCQIGAASELVANRATVSYPVLRPATGGSEFIYIINQTSQLEGMCQDVRMWKEWLRFRNPNMCG
jgi:hypothetical protein